MYPRPLRTRTLPRCPWHLSSLFSLKPSVCATLDRVRSRSSSFSRLVSRRPPPRLARATTTRRRNRLVCRHRPRHRRPRLLAFRSKTLPKPSTRVRFPRTSSTPRSARSRRRRASRLARAPSSRASSRASSPPPPRRRATRTSRRPSIVAPARARASPTPTSAAAPTSRRRRRSSRSSRRVARKRARGARVCAPASGFRVCIDGTPIWMFHALECERNVAFNLISRSIARPATPARDARARPSFRDALEMVKFLKVRRGRCGTMQTHSLRARVVRAHAARARTAPTPRARDPRQTLNDGDARERSWDDARAARRASMRSTRTMTDAVLIVFARSPVRLLSCFKAAMRVRRL